METNLQVHGMSGRPGLIEPSSVLRRARAAGRWVARARESAVV